MSLQSTPTPTRELDTTELRAILARDAELTVQLDPETLADMYAGKAMELEDCRQRMMTAAGLISGIVNSVKCGDEETAVVYQQRVMNLLGRGGL